MKKDIQKFVVVGNTVEIPVLIDNQMIILKSSVEGVGDNNRLIIGSPLFKLNYYNVKAGDVIRLHIKSNAGVIEFKAKILKRVMVRNISTLVLEAISDPILIQRREFFRLNILKDVSITHNERKFNLMTKEISAGGLSGIVIDIGDVSIGDKIQVVIDTGSEILELIGDILYCQLFKDSIRRYEYRIKFLNVSQVNRRKLLNYVFSEQRKLMRKK
ncbi:MAG: PilZ domain-containing protein [Acidaminobacteraceae bacterium]